MKTLPGGPYPLGATWDGSGTNFALFTAHDGFTLHDLVSYNEKHNEANGEENRDGECHNRSWNCGVDGPTDDPEVNALRARQKRNFIASLNAHYEPLTFRLPSSEWGRCWKKTVDTSLAVVQETPEGYAAGSHVTVEPRSLVLLRRAG